VQRENLHATEYCWPYWSVYNAVTPCSPGAESGPCASPQLAHHAFLPAVNLQTISGQWKTPDKLNPDRKCKHKLNTDQYYNSNNNNNKKNKSKNKNNNKINNNNSASTSSSSNSNNNNNNNNTDAQNY